ncbi:hypothetical protein AB0M92_24140 [Streptomyces sp. NPDC051582]|uniref:hypothetical protein n=1 Tax=Streptomyces sp. NPDC051582 TaxID=3155167 RepID=UPI00341757D1
MEEVVLRLEELLFPSIVDVAVLSIAVNDEAVQIEARSTVGGAICPGSGSWSRRIHSSYLRFPADVPAEADGLLSAYASAGSSARLSRAGGGPSPNSCQG